MLLIWRGYGPLVAILAVLGFPIAETVTILATGDNNYYAGHVLPQFIGFVLAALIAYGSARILEKTDKPKILIDKETGKEIVLSRKDEIFFIPVKYVPYIIIAIGIFNAAMGIFNK